MKWIIGLDVGGTKCAAVLAQVGGTIQIRERAAFPTRAQRPFREILDDLFAAVRRVLSRGGVPISQVEAIGVSCGGPLDSRRGIVVGPPNLPTWVDIPIVELLRREFGVPAYLQNDAKACALVEWQLGAGRGTRNMVFLTMGTGMGSGIIAEGRLVCGACDMGGEIGHMRIEPGGPMGFGKHGSFSGFTSGGGIARFARQLALDALDRGRPFAFAATRQAVLALDTKAVAAAAHAGDPDARCIFSRVGEKLGKGVALLIDILNPELVVIGSIFVRCEALLRPSMEQVLAAECIPYSLAACRVVPAQTGEQLGDLAGVMAALHGPYNAARAEHRGGAPAGPEPLPGPFARPQTHRPL